MSRQLVGMVALSAVACTTLIGLPDLPDISGGGSPGGGSSGAEAGATSHGGGAPSGGNIGGAGADSTGAGEAGIPNENGGSGASNVGGAGAGGVNAAGANTGGTSAAGTNAGGTSAAGTNAGGSSAGAGGAHAGAGGAGAGGAGAGGAGAGSGGAGAGSGGTSAGGMNAGGGGGGGTKTGPCDIYKTGGTPCVAAHSTVRALFGAYTGKLYQIRDAGGTTKDITALSAGGVADAAAQDTFCAATTCVVTIVYDQTGKGNDLQYQGTGSAVGGMDKPANASTDPIRLGGSKAYSLYIASMNSYWVDGSSNGMPTGQAPEGMYMVTSGKHYNAGCCFSYGNSATNRNAVGTATIDAISFSSETAWGSGAGAGPWLMINLGSGLAARENFQKNLGDPSQTATFVTAVLKNSGTTEYALRGSDATSGSLSTYYKGAPPNGYNPMKKQGAIVLGSDGDCCLTNASLSAGTFYEGCIVSGYPTDATEDTVQANIVAAAYTPLAGL